MSEQPAREGDAPLPPAAAQPVFDKEESQGAEKPTKVDMHGRAACPQAQPHGRTPARQQR